MAGACSPGLRCHGRLARVEAVSAAINSPLTSSAPPRTWCTRCTCEWCTAAARCCSDVVSSSSAPFSSVSALVAAAFGRAVGSAAFRVGPGGSRAACTKTRAAALPLVLRCCPQQPHIGLVLFDRAGLRSSVLSTKRASTVRVASGDGPRATCSRSGSYRRQLHRRQADSGRHGRCIR